MFPVPATLRRLADQIDGWLELRCPEKRARPDRPVARRSRSRARRRPDHAHPRRSIRQGRLPRRPRRPRRAAPHAPAGRLGRTDRGVVPQTRQRTARWRHRAACERLLARNHKSSDVGHFNLACYLALVRRHATAPSTRLTIACGLDSGSARPRCATNPTSTLLRKDPNASANCCAMPSRATTPKRTCRRDRPTTLEDVRPDEDAGPNPRRN
jgi:hypothetical protein